MKVIPTQRFTIDGSTRKSGVWFLHLLLRVTKRFEVCAGEKVFLLKKETAHFGVDTVDEV